MFVSTGTLENCDTRSNGSTFRYFLWVMVVVASGFSGSSAGKESAWNAGDPSSIPAVGRSPGEGIGYPLQYSWAFRMAQMVKNLPAMWETWV